MKTMLPEIVVKEKCFLHALWLREHAIEWSSGRVVSPPAWLSKRWAIGGHVLSSLFVLKALWLTSMNCRLKHKAQTGMVGLATSSFWTPLCEEAGSRLPGSHEGILRASTSFLGTAS